MKWGPYLASAQTCRPTPRVSLCPALFGVAWRGFPGRSPFSSPETLVLGWKHPNPAGTQKNSWSTTGLHPVHGSTPYQSLIDQRPQTGGRGGTRLTFTASWRIWLISFGPLSMKALRGTQLFSRSSTVSCSRKRILAGNSLLFVKDRIRPKYWSIKDWKRREEWGWELAAGFMLDDSLHGQEGAEPEHKTSGFSLPPWLKRVKHILTHDFKRATFSYYLFSEISIIMYKRDTSLLKLLEKLFVTFAFAWSSLGPTVLIIWQRHSRSSPISLSWTLFFFSRSFRKGWRREAMHMGHYMKVCSISFVSNP